MNLGFDPEYDVDVDITDQALVAVKVCSNIEHCRMQAMYGNGKDGYTAAESGRYIPLPDGRLRIAMGITLLDGTTMTWLIHDVPADHWHFSGTVVVVDTMH